MVAISIAVHPEDRFGQKWSKNWPKISKAKNEPKIKPRCQARVKNEKTLWPNFINLISIAHYEKKHSVPGWTSVKRQKLGPALGGERFFVRSYFFDNGAAKLRHVSKKYGWLQKFPPPKVSPATTVFKSFKVMSTVQIA